MMRKMNKIKLSVVLMTILFLTSIATVTPSRTLVGAKGPKRPASIAYLDPLIKTSNYLLSVQDEVGFWGKKPLDPWNADAENPTGLAIITLLKAYEILGTEDYKTAAVKGGDFLISEFIQEADGSFDINKPAHHTVGDAYMNHMSPFLTAWIRLYQETAEAKYLDAATAFGDYLLTNGARCTDTEDPLYGLFGYLIRPTDYAGRGCFSSPADLYHSHYLNYGYEQIYGLALLSQVTEDSSYLDAAELGTEQELYWWDYSGLPEFPAEMGQDGGPLLNIHYGSVKMLAYAKLYDITEDGTYLTAIMDYIAWLMSEQNVDGSFGTVDPVRSTTWAVQALLEAYRLTGDAVYEDAAIGALDWLIITSGCYNSDNGEVYRYPWGTPKVYIAYSQTPFGLSMALATTYKATNLVNALFELGVLNQGQANSLLIKIEKSSEKPYKNQVNALYLSKILTESQKNLLLNALFE